MKDGKDNESKYGMICWLILIAIFLTTILIFRSHKDELPSSQRKLFIMRN